MPDNFLLLSCRAYCCGDFSPGKRGSCHLIGLSCSRTARRSRYLCSLATSALPGVARLPWRARHSTSEVIGCALVFIQEVSATSRRGGSVDHQELRRGTPLPQLVSSRRGGGWPRGPAGGAHAVRGTGVCVTRRGPGDGCVGDELFGTGRVRLEVREPRLAAPPHPCGALRRAC